MENIKEIEKEVLNYGEDIIFSEYMKIEKECIQHGKISVYEHSFNVACLALFLVNHFHIEVDEKSLVRGALLHDYFLYDWHVKDKSHRLHGFTHAKKAFFNATRDFKLNKIEIDIVLKHMFPLNLFSIPKCRESIIVCIADKICATTEIASITYFKVEDFKI